MENKTIVMEQTKQQVLTIIEALQLYKDIAVRPMYKENVERHIIQLVDQLEIQGIHIYRKDYEPDFTVGETVEYDGEQAIVVGPSNEDNFIKIAIAVNGKLGVIDVPCILCRRWGYEDDN